MPSPCWSAPSRPRRRPRRRRHAVRHPLRLGLFALVLIGLVAGSAAWLSMDKSVRLTVDGQARSITTYASTVGGVLDDQKIAVGQHDTLAPGRETKVSDGAEIVLRRGRLVTLTVDGRRGRSGPPRPPCRRRWSRSATGRAGCALGEPVDPAPAGRVPAQPAYAEDRHGRRGRQGHTITTTAPTVGEALEQAGVTVDADDRVSQLAGAAVRPGMTITVTRVVTRSTTTRAVIEYKTVKKTDPKAAPDSRTVQTRGVTGLQEVTRVMTYVDGKLTSTKVAKVTVLTKPVDEVVVLGPPAPADTPSPPAPRRRRGSRPSAPTSRPPAG